MAALLPTQLGGVELHTFPVGAEIVDRLAARLGVPADDLETAFASEHGSRFLQMYAIRLGGTSAEALVSAWSAVAYPPEVGDVAITGETINGVSMTAVHSPSTASRLGTFYVDRRGETLIVVQAFDPLVAAEALASIP